MVISYIPWWFSARAPTSVGAGGNRVLTTLTKGGSGLHTTLGVHLLLELKECNAELLNSRQDVRDALVSAAREAKATIVEVVFHEFSPHGVSGMVVIAESHLAIHTWPEYRYAAVDIFTCGTTVDAAAAADYLIKRFQCKHPTIIEVRRGVLAGGELKLPHKPGEEVSRDAGTPQELQMVL